ncbi:hypothetical protein AVEN_98734-1 [Araneus ventricosus]|uniref:Uncharacterized protein n=1 Tax=Araneus ventricosus TaxID=182803 RepID=A0A4Y2TLE3_ARAVE|nr:hypothetical protein AVEN_98734-1 [Araneus ventricosus]
MADSRLTSAGPATCPLSHIHHPTRSIKLRLLSSSLIREPVTILPPGPYLYSHQDPPSSSQLLQHYSTLWSPLVHHILTISRHCKS